MTAEAAPAQNQRTKGILGWIERTGDKLPDPVFIFVYLLAMLMAVSVVGALMGWSAINPSNGDVIRAQSLFTSENLEKLIVQMPQTLTSFAPLGMVLVVMLGAGVAERSGFFSAFMRAGVKDAPKALLTPIVVFMGVMGNQAADAAYVVLIALRVLRRPAAPLSGLNRVSMPSQCAALGLSLASLALSLAALWGPLPAELIGNPLSAKELGNTLSMFVLGALLAAGLSRSPLFAPGAGPRGGVAMLGLAFEQGDRFVRRWPSAMLALLLIAGGCGWLLIRG